MTTTYFLNCIMGNVFQTKTNPSLPSNMYLGLSSTSPNIDGTGVSEPSASAGYNRVAVTQFGEPVDGVITNNAEIRFAESTDNWGVMTHFVLYDAPEAGNLLMSGELLKSRNIESETVLVFKTGHLSFKLANPS